MSRDGTLVSTEFCSRYRKWLFSRTHVPVLVIVSIEPSYCYYKRNIVCCVNNKHPFLFIVCFKRGALCLRTAAEFGQASVVRAVLERGCKVDAKQKVLSSFSKNAFTFLILSNMKFLLYAYIVGHACVVGREECSPFGGRVRPLGGGAGAPRLRRRHQREGWLSTYIRA